MTSVADDPAKPLVAGAAAEPVLATAPETKPWPPRRDANYSLFVMAIVVMFTVLDRQVLALLIDPIKHDFGISDSVAALLIGLAFSLPYGIIGIPVARLADSGNRRNLIAASLAVWSACTVACGAAQGYVSLLIARMGVGAGESGYGPASWSIATDYWPGEKVAFATAAMGFGATLGTGLALFLGGAVLHFVSGVPPLDVGGLGVIRSWQWTFIIVGAPGLIWSLIVLTSKEPPRRGLAAGKKAENIPVKEVVKWLRDDWRSYLATIGGFGCRSVMLVVSLTWTATLLHREFHWDLAKVGLIVGSITLLMNPIGLMLGAKISERWNKQGRKDTDLRIIFYSLLVNIPVMTLAPLMPNPWLVIGLNAFANFVIYITFGPSVASFQVITPNRIRAQVGSLTQFCNNVISQTISPLLVALCTDYIFHDDQALKYSMAIVTVIMGSFALLLTWQGLGPYARSYERAVREFAN